MPGLKITNQSIEDGLDRKHLTIIKQRFLDLNRERKVRTRSALANRQKVFFDLVPLIFHINHPMLPGYVSGLNCYGINQYEPGPEDIKLTKSISKSFKYNKRSKIRDDIQALYVMGSVGTVAHSDTSDLDIWVCYSDDLSRQQFQKLQSKCERVKSWALSLGLEVHFFLMDPQAFQRGENSNLSTESSGSAQHYLLLDEFYRTAIHLAGKLPLWWFVPTSCERDYSHYSKILLEKRFIRKSEVIDFGPVSAIPQDEFIGAGIWQLYKAIESPYKSMLKLLLLEAYVYEANQSDSSQPLCLDFKQKIYDGDPNFDRLDPYILILQKIESCLYKQKQIDRLQLARRCLYFKTNRKLSKPAHDKERLWQRNLMKDLALDWKWTSEYILFLDNRKYWNIKQSISESGNIILELKKSYQLLLESKEAVSKNAAKTASKSKSITQHEFEILGRKLAANFETREGKISIIHKDLSDQVSTSTLCFLRAEESSTTEKQWALCSGDITFGCDRSQALQESPQALPLVVWAHWNGILTKQSHFTIIQKDTALFADKIHKVCKLFRHQLQRPSSIDHEEFEKPASLATLIFIINFANKNSPDTDKNQFARISDHDDAMSYGVFHDNLISTVDLVVRNTWGELSVHHFSDNAVIESAQFFLDLADKNLSGPSAKIHVYCDTPNYGLAIERRFKALVSDLSKHFLLNTSHRSLSFFFALGKGFYAVSKTLNTFDFTHLANHNAVIRTKKFFKNRNTECIFDSHIPQSLESSNPKRP